MAFLFKYIFILLIAGNTVSSTDEKFYEELHISPQRNGFLSATFKFLVRHKGELGNHYELFPKAIGEIIQKYSVDEFHFSLSDSFWRTYEWGYQPSPATPTGAQIWAWFNGNSSVEIDTRWPHFVYAVGSFFCVSLIRTAPQQQTIQHRLEHRPQGVIPKRRSDAIENNNFLRSIVLPEERVCTENLVPWKKLLPCKGLSGIGSLLMGNRLHYSQYRSIAIDVRRICEHNSCVDGKELSWELVTTMTVVFDTAQNDKLENWSFSSLFGTHIAWPCPVASSSIVFIDKDDDTFLLRPSNWSDVSIDGNNRRLAAFDVASFIDANEFLNVVASYPTGSPVAVLQAPPVYIHSFVAGTGLREGELVSQLINKLDVVVPVLYSHAIPWFLRTYYHTLEIVCDGRKIEPTLMSYQPGRDRLRPHLLEFAVNLPPTPTSPCQISIHIERALLHFAEYPPDAHHGFSVAPPMISFYHPVSHSPGLMYSLGQPLLTFFVRMPGNTSKTEPTKRALAVAYGKSLLVNLPTPDFSMPYNVICLVCTVVALAFGPMHSLTTKRLIVADAAKAEKNKPLAKIKDRIQKIVSSLKNKLLRRIRAQNAATDGSQAKTTPVEKRKED